jgi:hypothetical protein
MRELGFGSWEESGLRRSGSYDGWMTTKTESSSKGGIHLLVTSPADLSNNPPHATTNKTPDAICVQSTSG